MSNKTHHWVAEISHKLDSSDFNWVELRPLFNEHPDELIFYVTRSKSISQSFLVPLFIHLACGFLCLGASGIYHTFNDMNERLGKFLVKFDYAGIVIMIAGSNTPPIYYTFFCEETRCN